MKIRVSQVFLIITFFCVKSAFATAISGTYNSDIGSPSSIYSSLEVAINGSATANQKIYSHQILVGSSGTLAAHNTISAGSGDVAITLDSGYLELYSGSSVQGTIDGAGGEVYIYGTTSVGEIGSSNAVGAVYTNAGDATFNGNISAYDFQINNSNAIFAQASTAITVSNQLYINGTSTLSATVSSSSSTILEVTGSVFLEPSIKLNLTTSGFTASKDIILINVTDVTDSSALEVIADSDINVNGSGSNIYNDATFTTSVDRNRLMLHVIYASISPAVTFTVNAKNSYDAIINSTSANGELAVLKAYLQNNSISNSAKESAAKSTTPQVDNGINRISFNSATASMDVVLDRLQSISLSSKETPLYAALKKTYDVTPIEENPFEKKYSTWGQVFGSQVSQGNTRDSEGYKSNLRGLAFGLDKKITKDLVAGAAFSYATSDMKSRGALKKTNMDAYQINLYSGQDFDKFFFNNLVGFVFSNYESSRAIPVGAVTANANYNGKTYIARSMFGLNEKFKSGFIFSPAITITGAHNSLDNYSENNAGTLNLRIKNSSSNFFETRAGLALSKVYKMVDYVIMPEILTSYGYDFAGSKQRTSSNFIGQTNMFDSTAANIARGSLKMGIGAKIYSNDDISFNANYIMERRNNYLANSLVLKGTYKF